MTLDANGFIRHFLLHRLPDGFHRIRHGACPGLDPGASSPALHIGLLDHSRQRSLDHAARLQGERSEREVGTLPEFRDAQLDGAGAFGGKSWVLP